MLVKIKEILKNNEYKIILVFGFILVAVLSFEAGMMKGQAIKQNQVVVNSNSAETVCGASSGQATEASNLTSEDAKPGDNKNIPPQNCAFVGSKNSNKYHLPTCQYAKRIKPENTTCFKDKNEAELRGYQPDKSCIK
ncbi:MAG: hypothetical protein WCV59_01100 [Parcubacteria group bacterium]|jgi:hypothetical protein